MSPQAQETPAGDGLRRLEQDFVGEVLAVLAHETNNRLATMQEAVGLLGDVLEAARSGRAEAVKECRHVAAGLEPQLAQLGSLARHLGGFADRMRAGELELNAALEELLALTERQARQGRVRVAKDFAAGLPALHAEPALFQALVHRLVKRASALLPAEGTVRIATFRHEGAFGVRILPEGIRGGGPLADEAARELAGRIGARVEEAAGGGGATVLFPAPP